MRREGGEGKNGGEGTASEGRGDKGGRMGVCRSTWGVKNEELVRVGRGSGKGKRLKKCLERKTRTEEKYEFVSRKR